ncbi:glycolate oxidase iron-sulfur subunit [Desulfonispora thiosulfatigenes DSM 11270]|uniref:Glycolate oxidase iron-sulfur subunit n=1 Tax=Desulfonispora thiosulfatigenes DSM 11270 TaxID=656914 RepID=A0A1W1VM70_DESTI|nr:(Fe-S)-binding protein [Desulfonispora thiosulfatigenes]SMB94383.1 glycolate oxidase iron-sulfur subunit [Desulfonispora thiosulfatigenes DSM 11270]
MALYTSLEAVKDEIAKCMKCGNCQAVCPIYLEERIEGTVARGKIKLVETLLDNKLEVNEEYAKKLDLCLTCKACSVNCPCGVQVDKIILGARAEIARRKGISPIKKLIFKGLENQKLLNVGAKAGGFFQGIVFKKHKTLSGAHPRFPFGLDLRRIIPNLATTPLRDKLPEVNKVKNPVKKVAFFTGCTMNYAYIDVGEALVNVLLKNNIEVIIPKNQHCCGTPILTSGDAETATKMAKSHIDIFSALDVDKIITGCGSCGMTFNKNYLDLLEAEPEYYEKAKKIAAKVIDISDFLMTEIDIDKSKLGKVDMKVTYHDPCHLNRGMGVKNPPREIIKSIPGIDFIEMKNADRCCGGAGSFTLSHYELSMNIHKHKVDSIKDTKAEAVITACPACMMQITDGMNRFELELPIYHIIQLLDMSYKAK